MDIYSYTYTIIQYVGIYRHMYSPRNTHTPSHVREAHTDEKLSVSTEDISEGGIRSFSPLGD